MGKMKNYLLEQMEVEDNFKEIVQDIIKIKGLCLLSVTSFFNVKTLESPDIAYFETISSEFNIINLKIYYGNKVSYELFQNALVQTDRLRRQCGAVRGVLVATVSMTKLNGDYRVGKTVLRPPDGVDIWDLTKLLEMAGNDSRILNKLLNYIKVLQFWSLDRESNLESAEEIAESSVLERVGRGAEIAGRLEASQSGHAGGASTAFENLCQEALQFLYGEDFVDWRKQSPIAGGYHRLDLIARLVTNKPFWTNLAHDFRTRYVVFEFKNYNKKITQGEIFTTEKYLYTNALRSVAIIVSRKGIDKNAIRTVRGALRDQGKLILNITMAELCKVLRGQDNGDDPVNFFVQQLDDLLVNIER